MACAVNVMAPIFLSSSMARACAAIESNAVGAEAPTPKDSSNQNEYADVGGLFDQRVRGAVGKSLRSLE